MMRIKSGICILLAAIVGTFAILGGCASQQADKPMPGQQAGNLLDDSYLTTAVKTKLLGDISLKSFNVHVTTRNRVVTLSGTLPSDALRDEAVRVAKSVDGVVNVVSELEVKPE
ncbi:MAG TPA: BON domain-containing protein [Gammaproteobacteria bacterium]|nr:BON domain-containing protein [Gammaproteobacteria bacterium]